MGSPENRVSIRPPAVTRARATAALLVAGSALVAISLVLPHPSGGDETALVLTALAMAVAGGFVWLTAKRIPGIGVHLLLAAVTAVTSLLIYESGIAVGQYGTIFVWATLVTSIYFPRRIAALHLVWLLVTYGTVLFLVESPAAYSPLPRWLFTMISLSVVMLLITSIVARRARADERARRFFDLSRDMLCTANAEGYFVELNDAWSVHLGYAPDELRAVPFLERVHPDDRERTEAESAGLFEGAETLQFENRYLAKDGSWHWLRWRSPLSVAILDIDHFKEYNDSHGHLAGDEVLRAYAKAWDSALRGEDMIAR